MTLILHHEILQIFISTSTFFLRKAIFLDFLFGNFLKKSDGIRRKKQKIIKPIEIKIACLEAKKKGLS